MRAGGGWVRASFATEQGGCKQEMVCGIRKCMAAAHESEGPAAVLGAGRIGTFVFLLILLQRIQYGNEQTRRQGAINTTTSTAAVQHHLPTFPLLTSGWAVGAPVPFPESPPSPRTDETWRWHRLQLGDGARGPLCDPPAGAPTPPPWGQST